MLFSVSQDPYPLFPRCHQDDCKTEDWGTGVREQGLNPTLSSQTRKLRQREVPRLAGHQVSRWPSRKQRALISSLSRFHSPILQPPDNKWTLHRHYFCFCFPRDSRISLLGLPPQHRMVGRPTQQQCAVSQPGVWTSQVRGSTGSF